jgi:iron(III) transport system permease protein
MILLGRGRQSVGTLGAHMSPRVVRNLWQYGLLSVLFALLGMFLIYPIFLTVVGAFAKDPVAGVGVRDVWLAVTGRAAESGVTLRNIEMVFLDPSLRTALLNSVKIATGTTLLAICIGLPLAVLGASYRFPGKGVFNSLILVPMILPPFVGAIGVRAILGRQGALNALFGIESDVLGDAKILGVMLVQALSLYPIIYLNATAALANLDPALDEAAENLGAGWWRRFFGITLPLVRPGLFAGATIVFIWSFTELGTPLMFDYYQVAPVQIFYGLKEVENSAEPYALTIVLLTMAIGMYVLGRSVFGGRAYAMYSKASRASAEATLTGWRGWAAAGAFAFVTALAIAPHLGVVVTSFTAPGQWYRSVLPEALTLSHYQQALGASESFNSILNSLKLSLAAMGVNIVLGIVIGYIIVRTKIKGRGVLDALCMLPLAVPGLVMAFGYVAMSLRTPFGKDGILGEFASVLGANPNPVPLLIAAYAVRRLPYIVRSTVAGLEQTSGEMEEAAVNLGASRVTAVRRVIVPLIMANLIAGGLLVFSFSMLEVSDSLILAQQAKDYPVTKAIYMFTERLGDGPYIAAAMGVWGMVLLATTLVAASSLLGKKLGAIFRV